MSLAVPVDSSIVQAQTGIILLKANLCEELVSTVTVLNVQKTVEIRRAGPSTVSTCNVRFETVRLGLDSDEPFSGNCMHGTYS